MTKTPAYPLLRIAALALVAGAAARSLTACGSGDACPSPVFAEPVTVTWLPTTGTVDVVTPVVVRWSTTNDPLPERYYEPFSVYAPPDAGFIPVSATRRTALHELTFDMRGLDSYVRDRPRFTATLYFPDPMAFTSCSHPGRGDAYVVDVTFAFDAAAHTATARFGEVRLIAGGCHAGAPGAGASGGAAALVVCASVLAARRRRAAT